MSPLLFTVSEFLVTTQEKEVEMAYERQILNETSSSEIDHACLALILSKDASLQMSAHSQRTSDT